MKNNVFKKFSLVLTLFITFSDVLTACSQTTNANNQNTTSTSVITDSSKDEDNKDTNLSKLEVCFGDKGEPFTMYLYDNDTAKAIKKHVGTANWRLPIYHYDDYENYELMQYYDIPSRYEIPSNPEKITSEKAGEVYYSEPNRIVLFYQDAEIEAEYTKVGYFDYTDEFVEAVKNNPVLQGWGNKIVLINNVEDESK